MGAKLFSFIFLLTYVSFSIVFIRSLSHKNPNSPFLSIISPFSSQTIIFSADQWLFHEILSLNGSIHETPFFPFPSISNETLVAMR
ncbi:hypothetical protein HanRHA438_Chr01g0000191 [Helianthus annuus]|nr:hypothetical protein HanIR_Chr01g0000211 [Helianthus annuus]KAJ0946091.1 hypothetical protein HanRHA438_Chr01g0000191 [Helianthus annuus]